MAVVAGGGADVDILGESLERGCQTYVTGNAATNCRLDWVQDKVRAFRELADEPTSRSSTRCTTGWRSRRSWRWSAGFGAGAAGRVRSRRAEVGPGTPLERVLEILAREARQRGGGE